MKNKQAIILFDGICNLCNRSVDFILKRDMKKLFRYVPLQSEEGRTLINHYKIPKESDSVILIQNDELYTESEAAIEIAKQLRIPWKWAGIFRIIPLKIRNRIYRWIARNRYRWFGKRGSCRIIQN